MRALAATVLMIAVSATAQSKPDTMKMLKGEIVCHGIDGDSRCVWSKPSPNLSAQILAKDGTLAVMLSDSEYSHLQQLRAVVVEEEKRLAVKYGADVMDECPSCYFHGKADHYEFHGQFLLIDKGLSK